MIYNIITTEQENGKITKDVKKGYNLYEAIRYIEDRYKEVSNYIYRNNDESIINELTVNEEYTRLLVKTSYINVLCRIEQDMDEI